MFLLRVGLPHQARASSVVPPHRRHPEIHLENQGRNPLAPWWWPQQLALRLQ